MLSSPRHFLFHRRRRRAGKLLRGDGLLKFGYDFHLVAPIKLLHRSVERPTFLALDKQLGYFRTSFQIFRKDFSDGALARFLAFDIRAEGIPRELASVFLLGDSRFLVPDLTLLFGQILPGQSNNLGQRAVIGLDVGRDVLTADK